MSIVRVKSDVAATVYDDTIRGFVALRPGAEYDDKDPIVKAHPQFFQSDATSDARPRVRSVGVVEHATATPGELRGQRK